MLPSTLFRSRWAALAWAIGVVWVAVEVAGSASPTPAAPANAQADATGETVNAGDLAVLAGAMGNE